MTSIKISYRFFSSGFVHHHIIGTLNTCYYSLLHNRGGQKVQGEKKSPSASIWFHNTGWMWDRDLVLNKLLAPYNFLSYNRGYISCGEKRRENNLQIGFSMKTRENNTSNRTFSNEKLPHKIGVFFLCSFLLSSFFLKGEGDILMTGNSLLF